MRVETVFIDEIKVGERRREEFGDIEGLAQSIAKYGLIQPIVVDGRELVAGERRLRACRDILKWFEIPARLYSDLTDEEKAEIELEENEQRLPLAPHEKSKRLVRSAQSIAPLLSSASDDKKSRGHKRQHAAPKDDIAKALGVSKGALVNAEQHVEAVSKYPELTVVPTQKGAIEAARRLDAMPEPKRQAALSKLATEGAGAVKEIVGKFSPKPAPKPKPAGHKYATNLSQIQVFINSIQSVGAEELTAGWTERETQDFLDGLIECRAVMNIFIAGLERAQRERRQAGEAA